MVHLSALEVDLAAVYLLCKLSLAGASFTPNNALLLTEGRLAKAFLMEQNVALPALNDAKYKI